MFTINGKLLDVNHSSDHKSTNLIFESEAYDSRLRRRVPRALSVLVMQEHQTCIQSYEMAKGKEVTLPCEPRISKGGALWYGTAGDGQLIT